MLLVQGFHLLRLDKASATPWHGCLLMVAGADLRLSLHEPLPRSPRYDRRAVASWLFARLFQALVVSNAVFGRASLRASACAFTIIEASPDSNGGYSTN